VIESERGRVQYVARRRPQIRLTLVRMMFSWQRRHGGLSNSIMTNASSPIDDRRCRADEYLGTGLSRVRHRAGPEQSRHPVRASRKSVSSRLRTRMSESAGDAVTPQVFAPHARCHGWRSGRWRWTRSALLGREKRHVGPRLVVGGADRTSATPPFAAIGGSGVYVPGWLARGWAGRCWRVATTGGRVGSRRALGSRARAVRARARRRRAGNVRASAGTDTGPPIEMSVRWGWIWSGAAPESPRSAASTS